jgi:DNA-binding beta-propeller fold protein YncE
VVDLSTPSQPRLLQTVVAGPGATAVAMNKPQTLVLVAAKMDDAIHVFRLAGKSLTHVGRVALGKGAAPTDVVFAPDGRHAYAVAWGTGKIMELAVNGEKVATTGQDVTVGRSSYGAVITPDGNWLINTNVGGAATGEDRTGTLSMVDLKTHRLALSLPVGKTPEHVALSPDGRHIALVLANGTANVKSAPNYNGLLGILEVFAIGPGTITPVAKADSCHWAQGATWSQDGKLILQQCASEKQIMVYRFDGKSLIQDKAATISFQSRPGSIATSVSR